MKICDFCGEKLTRYYCECCGSNYCKNCACVEDETGMNCPEYNCNYNPIPYIRQQPIEILTLD